MRLATQHSLTTIAFPSISTGAYRFPIERAAGIALNTTATFLRAGGHALAEVRFVLFTADDLAVYHRALERLQPEERR